MSFYLFAFSLALLFGQSREVFVRLTTIALAKCRAYNVAEHKLRNSIFHSSGCAAAVAARDFPRACNMFGVFFFMGSSGNKIESPSRLMDYWFYIELAYHWLSYTCYVYSLYCSTMYRWYSNETVLNIAFLILNVVFDYVTRRYKKMEF